MVLLFRPSTYWGKLILNSPDCFQGKIIPVLCVFQIHSCDLFRTENAENDDAFFQEFNFEGTGILEARVNLTPYGYMQKKPHNGVQKLNKCQKLTILDFYLSLF